MTDRATWIAFGNKGGLTGSWSEGDAALFNQYGIIPVNTVLCPNVKAEGLIFVDWMLSPEGQAAIAAYRLAGLQLFFPNAADQARYNSGGHGR